MFTLKLAQVAILCALTDAKFKQLTEPQQVNELLNSREFSFVSFHTNSEASMYIQSVMEEVMNRSLEAIGKEEWHSRDIQWLSANIEDYPDLKFDERGPTQIVYANQIKMT